MSDHADDEYGVTGTDVFTDDQVAVFRYVQVTAHMAINPYVATAVVALITSLEQKGFRHIQIAPRFGGGADVRIVTHLEENEDQVRTKDIGLVTVSLNDSGFLEDVDSVFSPRAPSAIPLPDGGLTVANFADWLVVWLTCATEVQAGE